jgi:hypothetical protein
VSAVKDLRVNSVDCSNGFVRLWSLPLWLKSNVLIKASLSPREARHLAVKLLMAADGAEDDR